MDIGVALTVFALIAPAELPDKTFVATLVLSTRYRGLPVFAGVAAAFAVQSGIAVAAGRAVALLPTTAVKATTAGIFAIGAVLMLRGNEQAQEEREEVEAELADQPVFPSPRRMATISFLVLFAAEWGDLSQLLTASFTAKYRDPLAVFLGSWLALVTVAGLAVTGGRALLRLLPLRLVRRIAAVAFAGVAVVTALEAAGVL